jgi:hypothetical protein
VKYLRLYENFEDNPSAYWIIDSVDINEIEKILSKFQYAGKSPYKKIFVPLERYIDTYVHKNMVGIFLGYNYKFDYWVINDDNDYSKGKKVYTEDGYEFQGEIKLIDGEIFIDKFRVDVEKYNI